MCPAAESGSGRLSIRFYEPPDRTDWDAFAAAARAPHFMFQRGYVDYHADRFADSSLVVCEDDRWVAVLPANRADERTIASHAGLTFGGLLASPALTTRRTLGVLAAVRDFLAGRGFERLVYKAVPHIYHAVPSEEDLYALFVLGARLVRREVSTAVRSGRRLAPTKGRKAAIRRAAGAAIEIEPSRDFAAFMSLEAEMLSARHGVAPTHSASELELLAERFPEQISLTVARRAGELLAGVVVYETEMVAHAQYIGASPEGYAANALDAVVDHLISERFAHKDWFDFGISTEDGGRALNEGLIRNKESFGGRAVVYDTYELPLVTD